MDRPNVEHILDRHADAGLERSLFMVLAVAFRRTQPDKQWLLDTVQLKSVAMGRSIFWLPDEDLLKVGSTFTTLNPAELSRSACRDLVSEGSASKTLCESLRYCEACLRRGWHSSLFQHWALPVCPLHLLPLRTGCPACGGAIATDLSTIACALLSCDRCGAVFERQALSEVERQDTRRPTARIFRPYRDAMPARFAVVAPEQARLVSLADARSPDALRGPDLHRFHVWPDQDLPGYRRRKCLEFHYPGDTTAVSEADPCIVETQVATTLREIRALLTEVGCMEPSPENLHPTMNGARIDGELLLGAAAYWKTVQCYRMVKYMIKEIGAPPRIAHFGYGSFACPAAWRETLRFEVIGLMARYLLSLRGLRCLIQVDWRDKPANAAFLPAWRLFQRPSGWALQMRPVADIDGLRRLVRRYGSWRLERLPDDNLRRKMVGLD